MAAWFIAWCTAPVNCHPPTVNLKEWAGASQWVRWKESRLLHVSASLWHIDKWWAETGKVPCSFPLPVLLLAAVTAECFFCFVTFKRLQLLAWWTLMWLWGRLSSLCSDRVTNYNFFLHCLSPPPKKNQKLLFLLHVLVIHQSRLFEHELPSFGDIVGGDICLLSNIMELNGTLLVVLKVLGKKKKKKKKTF